MYARPWLLALALVYPFAVLAWNGASSSADPPPNSQPATRNSQPQFLGAGSCAAAACHGADASPETVGSEHTTWISRDRHARAYEVLFDDRSKLIQKNLRRPTPAHEDQRCLQCHVAPEFEPALAKKAPYFRTDGVSCESCHGPAENWINVHHLTDWKALTPADKQGHGMRDLQSVTKRVQLCATCHVGSPGIEVDHELIAAGHPWLAFEFTAFHAFMPHHWPDARDRVRPDFEARAWLAGQLVAAHASLELLADRAGDAKKPWPEFAHHDCVACHHGLLATTRPPTAAKLGAVPWTAWDLGLTPHALRAIQADARAVKALQTELDKGWNNRAAIAKASKPVVKQLKAAIDTVDRRPVDSLALMRDILADVRGNGERSAQIALALAALQRAQLERKTPLPGTFRLAIDGFAKRLDMPREYEPEAVRKRLIEFKNVDAKPRF